MKFPTKQPENFTPIAPPTSPINLPPNSSPAASVYADVGVSYPGGRLQNSSTPISSPRTPLSGFTYNVAAAAVTNAGGLFLGIPVVGRTAYVGGGEPSDGNLPVAADTVKPYKVLEVLPTSRLYGEIIASLDDIQTFPNLNVILQEEIAAGHVIEKVTPDSDVIEELNEPKTDLSLAEDAAKDSQTIANMIQQIDDENGSLVEDYKTLAKMCSLKSAPGVIKEWILKNQKSANKNVPSDENLLRILGWTGDENLLLYNKERLLRGLFSAFCVDINDKTVSNFFEVNCGSKKYMCMLDWLIIIALHLWYSNKDRYALSMVKTLIRNFHYVLFGFLKDVEPDFTTKNPDFYKTEFTKLRDSRIFFNPSLLQSMIPGIHQVIRQYSSKHTQLTTLYPKIKPTSVRIHGGSHKGNKQTRKHRKIHKIADTIKVTKNPTTNTKKTRRHVNKNVQ